MLPSRSSWTFEHPRFSDRVPPLREIVIGAILVLFIRFRPQGLLPERRYVDRPPHRLLAPEVAAPSNRRFRFARTRAVAPLPTSEAVAGSPLSAPGADATAQVSQSLIIARPPVSPSGPAILVVEKLYKHFGGVVAVDNCSFHAAKGQVTGLIGPNGAGKSTAIDLIFGFQAPRRGTVLFKGRPSEGLPPHRISRRGLIRTFQTPREWPA